MIQNIIIKKSQVKIVLLFILLKLALDLSYLYVVSPRFAYSGFTISIDPFALIESYIFVIVLGLVIQSSITRPSHFFVWMLAVGALMPTLSYYAMHTGNRMYMYGIVFCFLIITAINKLPMIRILCLKEGRTLGVVLMIIMVCIVTVLLIIRGGLSHFNLDLSKVYDYRREVGTLINVGIWGYINTWVFKVVNPALIGWALWEKRHRLLAFFVGLQILFFGISSHKAVLFYPFLIAAAYIFIRKQRALEYLTWGVILTIFVSSVSYLALNYIWLLSLFVRRALFVPARLNFIYYELFSDIGYVYLSNSILSSLVNYPFVHPPPVMVSGYIYGHYNTWANNGFLATSYMHFGFIGMFIFSIIVGLLIWVVDLLVYKRMPLWFGVSIFTVPFITLFTSADLFTALLTHGIILGVFILLILGGREKFIGAEIKKPVI